jgi:hypothetical protein
LNKDVRDKLAVIFPGFEFTSGDQLPKSYPVTCAVKDTVTQFLFTYLTRQHQRVLDVGTDPKILDDYPNIHGCENSDKPHIKLKFYGHAINKLAPDGVCDLERDFSTWCTCDAVLCNHYKCTVVTFIHSIYYNKPEKVWDILMRNGGLGYSVHHIFEGKYGTIYEELTWYRTSKGRIITTLPGRARKYKHGNIDWLQKNDFIVVGVNQNKQYKVLTWKKITCDQTGGTVLIKLYAYLAVNEPIPSDSESDCEFTPPINSTLFENQQNELNKALQRGLTTFKFKYNSYGGTRVMDMPVSIVTTVLRHMTPYMHIGHTPKFMLLLTGYVSRNANSKFYNTKTPEQITLVIPTLVDFIKRLALSNYYNQSTYLRTTHNAQMNDKVRKIFEQKVKWTKLNLLQFTAFSFFVLLFSMVFFGSLFLPISIIIIICVYLLAVLHLAYQSDQRRMRDRFKLIIINLFRPIKYILLFGFFKTSNSQTYDLPLTSNTYVPQFILILTMILIILLSCCKAEEQTYDAWDAFIANININRSTTPVGDCPARPLDGPMEIDTIIDLTDYPSRKNVALHQLTELPHTKINMLPIVNNTQLFQKYLTKRVLKKFNCNDFPKRKGTVVVGPVFTSVFPLVFANNGWNELHSLVSRVTVKVDKVCDKEHWQAVCDLMEPETPIIDGGLNPEPRNYTLLCKYNLKHVDFPNYLARFPPSTQNKILKAREKYTNGIFDPFKHLSYNMFIKKEKQMIANSLEYKPTKPRSICGCSEFAKAISGVWFYNYSVSLKAVWNYRNWIWYCNGATVDKFHDWWEVTKQYITDAYYLASDFSTYDVTQSLPVIKSETEFYIKLGFNRVKHGAAILKSKLFSKIYGKRYRAKVEGMRKSGDNDTSSGNSRTTAYAIGSFFKKYIPKYYNKLVRIIVLGDDNFTAIGYKTIIKYFQSVDNMMNLFRKHIARCGFKIKAFITPNLIETEFLSCRFLRLYDGTITIAKKPGRVLCKLGHFINKVPRKIEQWLPILKGTLISAIPTGRHMPFLREYLKVVLTCLNDIKAEFTHEMKYKMKNKTEVNVKEFLTSNNQTVMLEFSSLYGFCINDEKEFGKHLKRTIDRYGLQCLVSSPYVDSLVQTELENEAMMN